MFLLFFFLIKKKKAIYPLKKPALLARWSSLVSSTRRLDCETFYAPSWLAGWLLEVRELRSSSLTACQYRSPFTALPLTAHLPSDHLPPSGFSGWVGFGFGVWVAQSHAKFSQKRFGWTVVARFDDYFYWIFVEIPRSWYHIRGLSPIALF